MTFRFALLAPTLALPLLLAACGDDPAPAVDEDGREASGEVLEGTISDDMIPLGEVRSQPPLEEGAEDSVDGATGDDAGGGSDARPASEPASEPEEADEEA